MNDDDDTGEPFAIPDLWAPSRFFYDVQEASPFLFSELKDINDKLITSFPLLPLDDGFFALPDLSFGVLEDLPTPSSSTVSIKVEEESDKAEPEDVVLEDIWDLPEEEPLKCINYLSWDAFENPSHVEPQTVYISEAGPGIFDAALAEQSDVLRLGNTDHLIVRAHIYASSLLALGLGRSSVLFSWDEEQKSFVKAISPLRISGCTGEVVDSHLTLFMKCGNATKDLQAFVDRTYEVQKSPCRIALADAISTMLMTLQARLALPTSAMQSFLQLQALFQPAELLLTSVSLMVKSVSWAKSDEAMLSLVFFEVQAMEHRTDWIRDILLEVLARVSKPFLRFMGEWMGIERETGVPMEKRGSGKSFVKVEDRSWINEQGIEMQEPDFILDHTLLPSFIPPEDAHMMFETGKSLRFLRTHHPDHPLGQMDLVSSANPPSLEWNFSWQEIEQVEAKAVQYEKDLLAAIRKYSGRSKALELPSAEPYEEEVDTCQQNVFGMDEEELKKHFSMSIAMFNQTPLAFETTDSLSKILANALSRDGEAVFTEESTFAPPISLSPVLSFGPIIAAQARIVNSVSMRLIFQKHNLREHLSLQRRFHLLGDGIFSSRLSHALFDPELETAERKTGVARTGGVMGLRLEGRDSWPPASSELRLALMGVLTESYTSSIPGTGENVGGYLDRKNELPGDLSFAVRDMSDDEIEKCKDANSVEALDFLRLSYKPPQPLEAVITPLSLYKYDQLFKLLLRVLRMLFVVSQLSRDATDRSSHRQDTDKTAQRFRIEAHHFVSCICGYFFDTGIDSTWRILERKLDEVEARIACDGGGGHTDDYDDNENDNKKDDINNADNAHQINSNLPPLTQHEGIDHLRAYHDKVLNRILFSLFLRQRQQPVMKLLEEIFSLILLFARHERERRVGVAAKTRIRKDSEGGDAVREMYARFKRKVDVFLGVCRGLSGRKGYTERGEGGGGQGSGSGSGLFDGAELSEENTITHLLTRLNMSGYYSRGKYGTYD